MHKSRDKGNLYIANIYKVYCCVAHPRGATGLSTVCECGIFWSHSLTIVRLYNTLIFIILAVSRQCFHS